MVLVVGEGEQVGAISEREGCSQESRYVHIPDGHVVVGCAFCAEVNEGDVGGKKE